MIARLFFLSFLILLGFCDSAFANYKYNPYTSKLDYYESGGGVSASSDITIPCPAGQILVSSGSGTWACGVNSRIVLNGGNGVGAVSTKIRSFANVLSSSGSDITRTTSTNLADVFTINSPGYYSVDYSDVSNVSCTAGLSLNSSQLTTSILSIVSADALSIDTSAGNSQFAYVHWDGRLVSGDAVRAHAGGTACVGTSGGIKFDIKRVY